MNYETMPFGKYKGVPFDELPHTYLAFALTSFDLPVELKNALSFELLDRIGFDYSFNVVESNKRYAKIWKKLANKYHPDKGGSVEAMQAINDFYEQLKDL